MSIAHSFAKALRLATMELHKKLKKEEVLERRCEEGMAPDRVFAMQRIVDQAHDGGISTTNEKRMEIAKEFCVHDFRFILPAQGIHFLLK